MSQFNSKMSSDKRSYNNQERNMGAFQRNKTNSSNQSYGSGGYRDWKNKSAAPVPPKEKVLVPEDFPALPSVATLSMKPKSAWSKPETTLAERMKEIQEAEEARKANGIPEKEEEDEVVAIPLSNWLRDKYLAKKREEQMKQKEMEEEEANYRWQMSRAMFPPKPEPEVPVYDENLADEELEAEEFNEYVDEAPEYEERI
jgi:hypothetical protein